MDMQTVIEEILAIEWDMFQHTENIGGRAGCQDDFETFYIMRGSQYANWTDEMRSCWLEFLKECWTADGPGRRRNLVAEKYGRMMQFTNLHYYNKHIAPYIPAVPQENYRLINAIVKAQIDWEKDFAACFPKLSLAGRPITSAGDLSGFTSMETYSRGELETYPAHLLRLYAAYVQKLQEEEKNLSLMIQKTTVQMYGYDTIEEAEASL